MQLRVLRPKDALWIINDGKEPSRRCNPQADRQDNCEEAFVSALVRGDQEKTHCQETNDKELLLRAR